MKTPVKRTKILCTLGPATDRKGEVGQMLRAGMDIARLNMSHGDLDSHSARLKQLRTAADKHDRPIGILVDLQGPKIRLGDLATEPVKLKKGQRIQLGGSRTQSEIVHLAVQFRQLHKEVRKGDKILLSDGDVELKVDRIADSAVMAHVTDGGEVSSRGGLNLPGRALSIPSLTSRDKEHLKFAASVDADWVALSFVRSAEDIKKLKLAMKRLRHDRRVVAKIEKPQALEDIDNIIDVADGIMVARGDLGVELSVEKVPAAQKMIIRKCALAEKWVIVATQMLESMIEDAVPTRAEASDVANAVYDGADCVMLSGETSIGHNPSLAVRTMAKICCEAESASLIPQQWRLRRDDKKVDRTVRHSTIDAALMLLSESDASALWVFTLSGDTTLLASKRRPRKPVIAFTPHPETQRYCAGLWGTSPLRIPMVDSTEEMIVTAEREVIAQKLGKKGDCIIVLAGNAFTIGSTHLIKVHRIGAE